MKKTIKKILKEQSDIKPFNLHKGGYLIPSDSKNGAQWLTQVQFDKLKRLNDNIKDVYELEVQELQLSKKHHKGVMQITMDKIKDNPDFNFKTKT